MSIFDVLTTGPNAVARMQTSELILMEAAMQFHPSDGNVDTWIPDARINKKAWRVLYGLEHPI